ncbi:hypothetical protein SteCoe_2660 [Stentor coeruleus]|uniref:MORN repeat-containing protein 3 n=1 Tax=Stentor coeruleus TaxID=5963 RepID=A0A1R2CYU5_9CILI|nr:hypothetical protein SteCoe_2660 [Stentor coeruleus]
MERPLSDEIKLKLFEKSYLKILSDLLNPENSDDLKSTHLNAAVFPLTRLGGDREFIRSPLKVTDEGFFIGEILENKPNGLGYYMDTQGNYYEGYFYYGKFHGKGRLFTYKGEVVIGNWNEGDCLYGIINSLDSKIYEGEMENLEPHGLGQEENDDYTYKGNFYRNKKHGKGKLIWRNGNWYEGDFIMGRIEGKGKQHIADYEYEGDFAGNKMDGFGVQTWKDGSRYEGMMKNGYRNGQGIYINNTKTYNGNWKNGKENGKGILEENGIFFEGIWENGTLISNETASSLSSEDTPLSPKALSPRIKAIKFSSIEIPEKFKAKCEFLFNLREQSEKIDWKTNEMIIIKENYWRKYGKGVYYGETGENLKPNGLGIWLSTSQIYEGNFSEGERNGFGRLINRYEEIYTGNWYKGLKQGYGVLIKKNTKYSGEWENNLFHGKGILITESVVYDGEWKYGLQHGKGILNYQDGKIYKGEFVKGVIEGVGVLAYPDGRVLNY